MEELKSCNICPHKCGVNRLNGIKGRCKCDNKIKIALASVHNYEEPCISGKNGSGTVFFSNCNLNCIYCQNYEISQLGKGKEITIEHLAQIFIKQQEKNVNNINLVTPTMYVPQIIEAIKIARKKGLNIPKIDNYFETAISAIKEMQKQVGNPIFNEEGIIQKGVIIRHLILPHHLLNTKNILKYVKENFDENTYISIMAQYFPTYKAKEDKLINRKLTKKEYKEIENYLYLLNLKNGYIQELGEHEEEYVPNFDLSE